MTYEFINSELSSKQIDDISILNDHSIEDLLKSMPQYRWDEILSIVSKWYGYFKANRPTGLFYTIPGQKPVFIAYRIN